jgi:hypothetical protein
MFTKKKIQIDYDMNNMYFFQSCPIQRLTP